MDTYDFVFNIHMYKYIQGVPLVMNLVRNIIICGWYRWKAKSSTFMNMKSIMFCQIIVFEFIFSNQWDIKIL